MFMKHLIKTFLTFLILLSSPLVKAQNNSINGLSFDASVIEHQNPGCPSNAQCSKKSGSLRKKFTNILAKTNESASGLRMRNDFRKKYGIPIEVWSLPSSQKRDDLIIFDSPCQNHNIPGKEILNSLAIVKSLKELKNNFKEVIPRRIYLKRDKKILSYDLPRGDLPSYLKNDRFYYTKSIDGNYYSYSISKNGSIQIESSEKPKNYAKTVTCSKELESEFKKANSPKNLFQETYCKAVWNTTKNIYEVIILGWSCS